MYLHAFYMTILCTLYHYVMYVCGYVKKNEPVDP